MVITKDIINFVENELKNKESKLNIRRKLQFKFGLFLKDDIKMLFQIIKFKKLVEKFLKGCAKE